MGDPGVLLDLAILSSSSLKVNLLNQEIQDQGLVPMHWVAQVNAFKGSGGLLLPSPPFLQTRRCINSLPPLSGSHRAIFGPRSFPKVNAQVALAVMLLKFVFWKNSQGQCFTSLDIKTQRHSFCLSYGMKPRMMMAIFSTTTSRLQNQGNDPTFYP